MTNKKLKSKAFGYMRKKLGHETAVQFRKAYNEAENYDSFHEASRRGYVNTNFNTALRLLSVLSNAGMKYRTFTGRDMGPPEDSLDWSFTTILAGLPIANAVWK